MNKILLIDRLNTENKSDEKHDIFFLIGGMNDVELENRLIDIVNNSGLIDSKEIILKYNGIHLMLSVKNIPKMTKLLSENDFSIFGIYQIYTPEEEHNY